jgi:hypothetical protein
MSLITTRRHHAVAGVHGGEAHAIYDLWLAENGGGFSLPKPNSNALVDQFVEVWVKETALTMG